MSYGEDSFLESYYEERNDQMYFEPPFEDDSDYFDEYDEEDDYDEEDEDIDYEPLRCELDIPGDVCQYPLNKDGSCRNEANHLPPTFPMKSDIQDNSPQVLDTAQHGYFVTS